MDNAIKGPSVDRRRDGVNSDPTLVTGEIQASPPLTAGISRRLGAALVTDSAPRPLELAVAAALLGLLSVATYGSHVRHAGFVTDDWSLRETWLIRTHGSDFGEVANFLGLFGARPALGLYLAIVQATLGFHQGLHLALAVLMAILLSLAFYLLLRTLRLPPLAAGVIAALTLIFPGSDSLRLWAVMGDGSWALTLLVLGAVLSLWSLGDNGWRAWLLRGGGLALYALSLLTYEIGIVALATSVLLYRCKASWRKAAVAWAEDLVVVGLVYLLATRKAAVERLGPADTLDHALDIARDAFRLTGTQVLRLGVSAEVALAAAVLVMVAAALVRRRLAADDPVRWEIRRWLITIGLSSVMTIAAYAVYATGWRGYDPLAPGLENRVNALATLPLVTIAYALGALAALLIIQRFPRWRSWVVVAPAILGLLLAVSYFNTTRDHAATWTAGYRRAQGVLNLMYERMPKPTPGSLVLSFGQSAYESPGIPVWAARWDLDSAVALRYGDLSLSALPAFQGTTIECGHASARPVNPGLPVYLGSDTRPYGKLYLFSADGRWAAPRNRKECLRIAPGFVPGPWFTPPGA
jgi:hypothetical protein